MTKLSTLLYITRGQRRETWTKTTKTGPTKTRKNNARENGFIITKLSNVFILFTYGKRRVGTGRGGGGSERTRVRNGRGATKSRHKRGRLGHERNDLRSLISVAE